MKYKWKQSMDGLSRVPAQIVGTELAKLEKVNKGALLPVTIVRAAQPKKSRLHPCFEWDDKAAAKKYRIRQAGEMLRRIHVEYKDDEGEAQTIRAFVNIKSEDGEGYYCHTGRILDDPELYDNVAGQVLADLIAIKNKYQTYKLPQLQAIWDAIDNEVLA